MTPDPIKQAGDSALLLEFGEPRIDPALNARAVAVAGAIRRTAIPGVRDVVSTFRSVAVFFNPLVTDVAQLAAALRAAAGAAPSAESGREVDIPIVYGGEAGPDLDTVAAFARCSREEVVARHCRRTYRVYMLGFLPGFPYLAHVDEAIAAPRHATPRLHVAAGSVGIAGAQTGIYPRESPGGWNIIGRTPITLFDPLQSPPTLLTPGDRVRFVPIAEIEASRFVPEVVSGAGEAAYSAMDVPAMQPGRSVTVTRSGLMTTVQDSGRWGYQDLGVSPSGAMDHAAHRMANLLLGNPVEAATLEAALLGPEIRVEQDTWIAVTGADMQATGNAADIPLQRPVHLRKGGVLRFGDRRSGSRSYIAFDGGVEISPVLGSRATNVVSCLGGIDGRPLRAGARLPIGPAREMRRTRAMPQWLVPKGGTRLRVLPGPQADYFEPSALEALQRTRFVISSRSDRMGYRLSGQIALDGRSRAAMVSDIAFMGGLQIPPSGEPILLMADRQTAGGYPQLAVVITADLPAAGQLGPGDWVEFELCNHASAIAALIAEEGKLLAVS